MQHEDPLVETARKVIEQVAKRGARASKSELARAQKAREIVRDHERQAEPPPAKEAGELSDLAKRLLAGAEPEPAPAAKQPPRLVDSFPLDSLPSRPPRPAPRAPDPPPDPDWLAAWKAEHEATEAMRHKDPPRQSRAVQAVPSLREPSDDSGDDYALLV